MANYIDKNELLHAIDKRNGRLPLWLDEILMQDCKVADVAPIVHGHWERIDDPEFICGDFECSNCSHREYEIDTDDCTPGVNCLHYCPNCGAKMDEVTK